jgi:hypothetical protein
MVMLRRVFVLLLLLAGAGRAEAQGFAGSWEFAAPNGAKISLVLRQDGRRVLGSLSGNGSRFEVEAEVASDGLFYGTAKAQAGSLFIGGQLSGEQLGVALAEMTAAGVPDMRNAQELRMQRVSAATADASTAGSAPSVGKGSSRAGAVAPAAPGGAAGRGNSTASSPADQQLSQLLVSSPWCYMRYSQAMGATTTERVVFSRDGRVVSRTQRESAVNNREGTYYGNSTDGEQGFWRVQNGNLMLSADGQNFQPAPMTVTRNSNGYPIITTGGKEYNQCN